MTAFVKPLLGSLQQAPVTISGGATQLSDFPVNTSTLSESDGVLIFDGNALGRMDRVTFKAQLDLSEVEDFGNFTAVAGTPAAGQISFTGETGFRYRPASGQGGKMDSSFAVGQFARILNVSDGRLLEGVVSAFSASGGVRTVTLDPVQATNGPHNGDSNPYNVKSFGAAVPVDLLEESVSGAAGLQIATGEGVMAELERRVASGTGTGTGSVQAGGTDLRWQQDQGLVTPSTLNPALPGIEEHDFTGYQMASTDPAGDGQVGRIGNEFRIRFKPADRSQARKLVRLGTEATVLRSGGNFVKGVVTGVNPVGQGRWDLTLGSVTTQGSLDSGDSVTLKLVGSVLQISRAEAVAALKAGVTSGSSNVQVAQTANGVRITVTQTVVGSLDDLSDVDLGTPSNGTVLTWRTDSSDARFGQVTSAGIANGAVGSAQLGSYAVTRRTVATAAIGTVELANDGVMTKHIQGGAVTGSKIASDAVGTAQIADGAVTSAAVASGTVGPLHLKVENAGTPTDGNFLRVNVTAQGTITQQWADTLAASALGTRSILGDKIADATIGGDKLKDGAVGTDNVADGAVTGSKIADGSVTPQKLATTGTPEAGDFYRITAGEGGEASAGWGPIPDSTVNTTMLADDAVTQDKMATSAVGSVELKTTNSGARGQALVRGSGTDLEWGSASTTVSDGEITAQKIASGAVVQGKIGTGAVQSVNLADSSVGSAALADGSVVTTKLAARSVGAAQIAIGAVGSNELSNSAATSDRIADGAVGASKMNATGTGTAGQVLIRGTGTDDFAFSTAVVGDNTITTDQLALDGPGTSGQHLVSNGDKTMRWADGRVQHNSIGTDELNVQGSGTRGQALLSDGDESMSWGFPPTAPNAVGTDEMRDGAVLTSKIALGSVTRALIADDAVSTDQMAITGRGTDGQVMVSDGDGTLRWDDYPEFTITEGYIETNMFADDALKGSKMASKTITESKIADGTLVTRVFANGSVTTAKIADRAIQTHLIATGSVTRDLMASNSVSAANIVANSITSTQIAANAVGSSELGGSAVQTGNVEDGAITHAKLAGDAVDQDNIADDSIRSEHIANDEVTISALSLTSTDDERSRGIPLVTKGSDLSSMGFEKLTASGIADNAVGSAALGDSVVVSVALADRAVLSSKIAVGSVTLEHMASNSVSATQLVAQSVGSAAIENNSISATQLAVGAVGSLTLADDAVVPRALADGAVGVAALNTTNSGTAGQVLVRGTGAGDMSFGSPWVRGAEYTVSGTQTNQIDFTNIPSGVNSVKVIMDELGVTGASSFISVALGDSDGIETSGYGGLSSYVTGTSSPSRNIIGHTGSFALSPDNTSLGNVFIIMNLLRATGNKWVMDASWSTGDFQAVASGMKELSGELTQIRIRSLTGGIGPAYFDDEGKVVLMYQ